MIQRLSSYGLGLCILAALGNGFAFALDTRAVGNFAVALIMIIGALVLMLLEQSD